MGTHYYEKWSYVTQELKNHNKEFSAYRIQYIHEPLPNLKIFLHYTLLRPVNVNNLTNQTMSTKKENKTKTHKTF